MYNFRRHLFLEIFQAPIKKKNPLKIAKYAKIEYLDYLWYVNTTRIK